MLTKTRETAAQGLTALAALQKPAAATDAQFETTKKNVGFHVELGKRDCGVQAKGLEGARRLRLKAALVLNPDDPTTRYSLGAAYLQDMPIQANDGFVGARSRHRLEDTWRCAGAHLYACPARAVSAAWVREISRDDVRSARSFHCLAASAARPADLNIPSAAETAGGPR